MGKARLNKGEQQATQSVTSFTFSLVRTLATKVFVRLTL